MTAPSSPSGGDAQDAAAPCAAAPDNQAHELAAALLRMRQTLLPKRLGAPGPTRAQLHAIFGAAAHAPDHGRLLPWRWVLVPTAARDLLGDAFAQALIERDAQATPEQIEQAREKAQRAPVLALLVVDGAGANAGADTDVPLPERLISAGCAAQNLLLMATALGFGSALTSGKALQSAALRTLFGLQANQHAVCFVSIGSVARPKPARTRPLVGDYTRTLLPSGQVCDGLIDAVLFPEEHP